MSLRQCTLNDLVDNGKLPSGHTFELKPDTIDTALAVGEASDPLAWREKALQCLAALKTVGGKPVQGLGGVNFIGGMPDVNVLAVLLAWTSETNGRELAMSESVPCPECRAPFTKVPLGTVKFFVRDEPLDGPDAIFPIELTDRDRARMPDALKSAVFALRAPTWRAAQQNLTKALAQKPEVVLVHRVLAALMYKSDESGKFAPVPTALGRSMPLSFMQQVAKVMDTCVPYMAREITITCGTCSTEIDIPFDQAGST